MTGPFDWLFDFNKDGKVDPIEQAMGVGMMMTLMDQEEKEQNDGDDDPDP